MRSIDDLPRVSLGLLPTPLEEAPRLSAALGGPPLLVKRDDLIGLALGGNKVRKLEYILGDALAQGADTVITSAGLQSNRARMTAAACRRVGLDCILLLCSNYGVDAPIGNMMLDAIFGADMRYSAAPSSYSPEALAEADQIAAELARAGRRAYLTEVGGKPEPLAEVGYFMGGLELARQCKERGVEPGTVLLATGSGGTQAGVLLGLRSAGLTTKVIGVSLGGTAADEQARVAGLAEHLADFLELDGVYDPADILVEDRRSGTGHGDPDRASVEAVRLLARTEGLLIDPVYMAKVVLTLADLIELGQIDGERPAVIWHTGGAVALFMHAESFRDEAFSEQPAPTAAGAG
jgi:1-aminocyclopropane-1-carboxylate deaminase/D-cysteine desulfhydrase-like pyridoxal-dependent ACC family enzyme